MLLATTATASICSETLRTNNAELGDSVLRAVGETQYAHDVTNKSSGRSLKRVKRGESLWNSIFRFKTLGKKKRVKLEYKDTFYNNEGWEVRHPPKGPGQPIPSNYFPNPSYGVISVLLLPPPLPPPMSKSVSPQTSNFGGYVGPVVYDDEEYIELEA